MDAALFQPFPMLAGRRAQAWRHQPEFRRPRHFHEEPEINLVLEGHCTLGVGDKLVELSQGELIAFAPGQDHVLLEASSDVDLFVMALRPELTARVWGSQSIHSPQSARLAPNELGPIREELAALGQIRDATAVEQSLGNLFAQARSRISGVHVLCRRALEVVSAEPGVSGTALSRRLGSGASDISRRFHRDLGVRFVEYRARLKLMEFIRLVDRGSKLSSAALAADFGSYAQCHRVFRRLLGCSPTDYFEGRRALVDEALSSLAT